jgi:hypothetical protein
MNSPDRVTQQLEAIKEITELAEVLGIELFGTGQASCPPQHVPTSRGPDALGKALAYLKSQCFSG